MRIDEIMTMNVATCGPGASLSDAARLMWEQDCGCVPVVADGKVVGMITDRDICMSTLMEGRPPAQLRVEQAMSRSVYACAPGDTVDAATRIMQQRQVRRLPVRDQEAKLVGIVSLSDFALRATHEHNMVKRNHGVRQVEQTLEAISRPRAMAIVPRA